MPLLHSLKLATPMPIRNVLRPFAYQLEKKLQAQRLRALYQTVVRPGDLVFDIGAHLGEHAAHFLALGARVIALEPQPACHHTLEVLRDKNPQMTLIPYAVSETDGVTELCLSEVPAHATCNPEYQMARFPAESFGTRMTVPMISLERLSGLYGLPDYVKIDVEGHEWKILKAMRLRPRFISFEFSRENLEMAEDIMGHLAPARFNVSLYSNQKLELKEWVMPNSILAYIEDHKDSRLCGDIFVRLQ